MTMATGLLIPNTGMVLNTGQCSGGQLIFPRAKHRYVYKVIKLIEEN